MTIAGYGIGSSGARRADETFRSLKGNLADLQAQLTTGRKAETHAALGPDAGASLDARARLASLEGYTANIVDAQLRVTLMSQGLSELESLARGLRTGLPGALNRTPVGQTNAQVSAEDGLRRAIDVLNTDAAGRFLFAGRASDTSPVAPYGVIMEGGAGRAGLKQIVAERKEADRGPDGMGRLALASAGPNVTLSEEAAGLPFGFKLVGASATGGLSAALGTGSPASASFAVTSQPASGNTVNVVLDLPDGSRTTLTLTATAAGPAGSTTGFRIGTTAADTSANLSAALAAALREAGGTALASASALQASRGFFAGTAANPSPRVAGPPFASATGLVAGSAADTVGWYRGDASDGSARETAPVRTGEGASVAIGARANEAPFQALLASLGALAAEAFPEGDSTARARYAALADRVVAAAPSGGIAEIATDLSTAHIALGQASDRVDATRNQVRDLIVGVENADPSEVATKLLETQTRLQASYQTTSAIARLTLLDYL